MFFKKIINLQYAITYFFEKKICVPFISIHLIILCIKILTYNYQKINCLRDILYFMSKSDGIKYLENY